MRHSNLQNVSLGFDTIILRNTLHCIQTLDYRSIKRSPFWKYSLILIRIHFKYTNYIQVSMFECHRYKCIYTYWADITKNYTTYITIKTIYNTPIYNTVHFTIAPTLNYITFVRGLKLSLVSHWSTEYTWTFLVLPNRIFTQPY